MKLTDIGYGNYVASERVLAVCSPDAAPIKRLVAEAKEKGRVVDVTCGKKTNSVLLIDNGTVLLCALTTDKTAERLENDDSDM